jgi:hypothetical protein
LAPGARGEPFGSARPAILNQLRFDCRWCAPHSRAMHEINDQSAHWLIAAVFSAIIGLIAYAGYFFH